MPPRPIAVLIDRLQIRLVIFHTAKMRGHALWAGQPVLTLAVAGWRCGALSARPVLQVRTKGCNVSLNPMA